MESLKSIGSKRWQSSMMVAMMRNSISPLCLLVFFVPGVRAQAPVSPAPRPAPDVVAGIPVNYDESKVGTYTLPDPLTLDNGKPIRDAKTWNAKRRPEIEQIFLTQQYGRDPGRPAGERFEVTDPGTPALDGKAIRKQITIRFSEDMSWPAIHLLVYLPPAATKPAPMFFSINFGAVQNAVEDPGITPEEVWDPKTNTRIEAPKGRGFGRLNVAPFLDAGIGVATYYYGDVDPDYLTGCSNGIRARYFKPGQSERAPDDWLRDASRRMKPSDREVLWSKSSARPDPAEIIRLAELHVVDAELRQRPVVAAAQQLDHELMLAARQRQPLAVGEIFRAHRQCQVHVVLQRAHQIGIAAG